MLRKIKKIAKYFLISILILLIAAIAVPYFYRDKIKAKVVEEIDKNVNAKVNFGEISFSAFTNFPRFSVSLHDVIVEGINKFDNDTLVSAKEVRVSFNLYQFLKGHKIEIRAIKLIDPFIHARVLADGEVNYNIMKPDSTTD